MSTTNDYLKDLRTKYEKDEKEGRLIHDLHDLRPANIRRVCLKIESEEISKEDRKALHNFYNLGDGELREKISKFEIDRYIPLCRFLKGETKTILNPDLVELMAVLVDFQFRPYRNYRANHRGNYDTNKNIEDKADVAREVIQPPQVKRDENQEKPVKDAIKKYQFQRVVLISLLALLSGLFIYKGFEEKGPKCMVWNGIKYEEVKCDPKYNLKYELEVVGYNVELVKNFKRLKVDCDTPLYQNGMPIVWCFRVSVGKYEYFNRKGVHPIIGDSLKVVSKYIRDNFLCDNKNI